MTAYLKTSILGGIVLFAWSVVSWMVLPWHNTTINHFKQEKAVAKVIRTNALSSGIYFMPLMDQKEMTQKKMQTPMVFAAVRLEGAPTSMTYPMSISLLTQIIAAFFVSWLLFRTKGLSYFNRVCFIVIFALAAGLVTEVPYWIWFGFDMQYTLVTMADLLIGWLLAGLVMAKFCKD